MSKRQPWSGCMLGRLSGTRLGPGVTETNDSEVRSVDREKTQTSVRQDDGLWRAQRNWVGLRWKIGTWSLVQYPSENKNQGLRRTGRR